MNYERENIRMCNWKYHIFFLSSRYMALKVSLMSYHSSAMKASSNQARSQIFEAGVAKSKFFWGEG